MDKVVQQNAASAEENASASEEMAAQAKRMKEIIGELVALIGGRKGRKRRTQTNTLEDVRQEFIGISNFS